MTATIENSRYVKGWRAQIFALADVNHGYYSEDSESASISYQGTDLHLAILFRDIDHARDFRINLEQRCQIFQILRCQVAENYDEVFLTSHPREIRRNHYAYDDFESLPNQTFLLSDSQSQIDGKEVSVWTNIDTFEKLQMIENPNHFLLSGLGMYKCSLTEKSFYPQYKNDPNNFLYLSGLTRQRFYGLNLTSKQYFIPSFAIHFDRE